MSSEAPKQEKDPIKEGSEVMAPTKEGAFDSGWRVFHTYVLGRSRE